MEFKQLDCGLVQIVHTFCLGRPTREGAKIANDDIETELAISEIKKDTYEIVHNVRLELSRAETKVSFKMTCIDLQLHTIIHKPL